MVAVVVVLLLPLPPPPHPRSLASYDVDANDDPRAVVVEDVTRSRRYWEDGIPLSLYILYFEVCEVERGATTAKKCYANPQFESDIFAARTKRLKKRSAHFFSILNSRDEKTATSRHCETDTSQQQEEGIFKTRESSPCFLSLSLIPSLVRRHTHIRTHTKKRAR